MPASARPDVAAPPGGGLRPPEAAAPPRGPAARRPAGPLVARGVRSWAPVLVGCVVLAAVSLLLPGRPTYDPLAWLIWGREIAHGTLSTAGGPSWKPLPVVFTTPFSLAGDAAAPDLWLIVARAGGLLGVVMGYRLGARLAGPVAGIIAALGIFCSEGFVFHAWRGNSEGLLVGLSLWAVERHLDGRRASAFVLGFAAALLRPEVWPFWGLYGVWLFVREPRRRVLVAACFAAVPLAWLGPEYLGSGDFLRAANRALEPNLDSPAYASFPALEVLRQSLALLPAVIAAGAIAAFAAAVRRRRDEHDHVVLVLAAMAGALLLAVAVMTQIGFSGNLRYVLLPIALLCVLAGAGWVEAVRAAGRRAGVLAAVALAALGLAGAAHAGARAVQDADDQAQAVRREADLDTDLASAVARAGGERALARCGPVFTGRFQVPIVAWTLHLRLRDVDIFPLPPGGTAAPSEGALARDPRFEVVARSARWTIGRACAG